MKPSSSVDQIQIETDDINTITQTQIAIISLLRTRHHLQGNDPVVQGLEQQQSLFAHSPSFLQGPATISGGTASSNANLDDFQVLSNTQIKSMLNPWLLPQIRQKSVYNVLKTLLNALPAYSYNSN